MNATITEADKNQIKQYLLGSLAEADEEQVELRLMSDRAFSEEFDIVVDEIATLYVSRYFTGDEKTQVEQYFLRSPDRRIKVQFICEMLRQFGDDGVQQAAVVPVKIPSLEVAPAVATGRQSGLWQTVSSFWTVHPRAFLPAVSLAVLLIVGGLCFWLLSFKSNPTYMFLELAMSSSERSVGTQTLRINLDRKVDELRIKLKLPTPTAPQYRASLRGEQLAPTQLTIEAQDAESITVLVPTDQLSRGSYAIELTEINHGRETPLRGAYEFTVD